MKTAKASPAPKGSSDAVPAGDWLQALLAQIARLAQADAADLATSPKLTIHRLRKRMKKLQSLLQLAESVQGDEAMAATHADIRSIKDALATQRDADVLSALEDDLGVHIAHRRGARVNAKLVHDSLEHLVDAAERMDLSALTWNAVTRSHLKACRQTRKAWKKAREDPTEKALHSWRRRVKDQYHQSLALHAWLGQNGRLRRMRRLGSLLGRCHDLDMFSGLVHTKDSRREKKLRHKVGSRREKLQQRIFRRAERIFSSPMSKTRHRVRTRLPAQCR